MDFIKNKKCKKGFKYLAKIKFSNEGKLKLGKTQILCRRYSHANEKLLSLFCGFKHFQTFIRQIRQSESFLTIVARTIEFSPFLIKFVKFNYCE